MKTRPGKPSARPLLTETILESISDGVFTVDLNWRITYFNRAAEEITGVSRDQAMGRFCSDVFRSNMCGEDCALRRTLKQGRPVIGKSGYFIDSRGNRMPISVSTAVLKSAEGDIIGGAETFRDLSEIFALRKELEKRFQVGDMVSRSPIMQKLCEALSAISASPSTVLILGETGTGKDVMAQTIHDLSPRKKGPFVAVNCGALPDTLLESELFGYKAGAFTGAAKDKPGRFARAKGGTLFLDEIGVISPAIQIKLLRVLQNRTFEPLGSTVAEKADVRIIAATNKDLAKAVADGSFREDLYYRVNVVRLELPPLRKRKEDIPVLARHFIQRFNRLQQKKIRGILPEALSLLMAHNWPGNIRELENVIEGAFVLISEGFIEISHLSDELTGRRLSRAPASDIRSAHDLLDDQAIRSALEKNHYNRTAAAHELGIHKTTLFRKIKKLNMVLPRQDGRSARK